MHKMVTFVYLDADVVLTPADCHDMYAIVCLLYTTTLVFVYIFTSSEMNQISVLIKLLH